MPRHFSASKPPVFIKYMGKKYRLKQSAIPAREAERKLEQVSAAIGRLERTGYPMLPVSTLTEEWTIDPKNIMNSKDEEGDSPLLIMWNPLTTELLLASENHTIFHADLHTKYMSSLRSYENPGYDDWVRAYTKKYANHHINVHEWNPLQDYWYYYNASQRRRVESLQRKGVEYFKRMLEMHGAGKYTVTVVL